MWSTRKMLQQEHNNVLSDIAWGCPWQPRWKKNFKTKHKPYLDTSHVRVNVYVRVQVCVHVHCTHVNMYVGRMERLSTSHMRPNTIYFLSTTCRAYPSVQWLLRQGSWWLSLQWWVFEWGSPSLPGQWWSPGMSPLPSLEYRWICPTPWSEWQSLSAAHWCQRFGAVCVCVCVFC